MAPQTKTSTYQALLAASILLFVACNGTGNGSGKGNDTAPGVVITPPVDTSSVITPPPTNDSNVIMPDSNNISR